MVGWTGAKRMPADAHVLPEQWRDFFERLEVMVFSGSAGHPRTADDDELRDVARRCVAQAHARLADDADLAAEVRAALAESPYVPWGTRLDVQGSRLPLGCERHEAPPRRSGGGPAPTGRAPQADTINEFLCLLRGPRAVGMGDYWIGIAPSPRPLRRAGGMASPQVRHDETPYITGRVGWLVRHVAGRGRKRRLLVARDEGGADWDASGASTRPFSNGERRLLCTRGAKAGRAPLRARA